MARRKAAPALVLGALMLALVVVPGASGAPGDATAVRVADILPGPASGNPQELFDAGGTLLFYADDGSHGNELWKSNGGPLGGGTEMIEIAAGSDPSTPDGFTDVGGTILFEANDGINGGELWKIAPPFTMPVLVENINTLAASSSW